MPKPFKLIDLFAGAGGMTLGFRTAGFVPVLAIEKEPDFAATYAENFGDHVWVGDIVELASQTQGVLADVVIGGPPCQGFSNLTGNKRSDPRRRMWRYFMDVVENTNCKAFVVENVPNLIKSDEGAALISTARQLGFHVGDSSVGILNAADFGVPQNRRRAIIMGSRLGPIELPSRKAAMCSLREALQGIPGKPIHQELPSQPASGSDLHIARNPTELSKKRYRLIEPGENRFDLQRKAPDLTPNCWVRKTTGGTDIFGRLEWDGPARCTIRCEFYKPEKGRYLHPSEHRPITHWEAARIQSFPDDYRWHGTKIRIAMQIGNAVPPLFAEAIAKQVMDHLVKHKQA